MSCLREVQNIFNDNSPLGLMKQDILSIYLTNEKTRKALFARDNRKEKEILALRAEIAEIKKFIGMKDEKITDLSDLPLFQLANG